MREKLWQRAVASESKNHSRGTQNVARYKSECGDAGSGEKNRAAEVAEKCRRRFGEWGIRMLRDIGAERPLRDKLDHEVDASGDDECEISRPRNRARRILHFAARNQRHLDSDKGEN